MIPSNLAMRPYRDDDEDAVVDQWRTCFPDDPPRNNPRQVIQRKGQVQPELFLIGLIDGKLVCTVIGGYDGYRGWVYHLATAPEHQRRGLGRRMMDEIERRLATIGCPKLNLQVRAENSSAVEFYRNAGYAIEQRVSMSKRLE